MEEKKPIVNILCATDNNYVPYCGIMLSSVFESNRDCQVNAYIIIDKSLSVSNVKRFEELVHKYGQKIEYLMVDNTVLSKFPSKGLDYWSIAMYYRIFAESLLPISVHRVLYLDCDVIVRQNLSPLWDLDMANKAVGVVPDIFTFSKDIYQRLKYPQGMGYFNSGVILINLDYWREQHICQQCLGFLEKHYDRLFANDQDVLNAILWDKKIQLPVSYNFQVQFLKHYFYEKESVALQNEILRTKENPAIIHYAVPQKPWNVMYYKMPFKQVWWRYKRISPWWYLLPQLPKRKAFNNLIKRFLLWPFGVMWQDDYDFEKRLD